jgi:hypothetical protein
MGFESCMVDMLDSLLACTVLEWHSIGHARVVHSCRRKIKCQSFPRISAPDSCPFGHLGQKQTFPPKRAQ